MSKLLDPKDMLNLFVDPCDCTKPYACIDAFANAESASLNSTSNILAKYKFEKFVTVEIRKTTKVVDYEP